MTWLPFGPDGGDARSFAVDPHDHSHLYLGTLTGWIYESWNGGGDWKRLASVGKRDNLALDSIVVDSVNSKRILVGAWILGSSEGGLYISNDGGVNWESEARHAGAVHSVARGRSIGPEDIGGGYTDGRVPVD